jgi:hypothetical protein
MSCKCHSNVSKINTKVRRGQTVRKNRGGVGTAVSKNQYESKTGSDCEKNSRRCWGCCVRLEILLEWNACRLGDMMDAGDLHVQK